MSTLLSPTSLAPKDLSNRIASNACTFPGLSKIRLSPQMREELKTSLTSVAEAVRASRPNNSFTEAADREAARLMKIFPKGYNDLMKALDDTITVDSFSSNQISAASLRTGAAAIKGRLCNYNTVSSGR